MCIHIFMRVSIPFTANTIMAKTYLHKLLYYVTLGISIPIKTTDSSADI